jgi:hypothetical protein
LLQAAGLSANVPGRDRLMELAEQAMDHMDRRRLRDGPAAGLWDDPGRVFGRKEHHAVSEVSWYTTESVMESLVTAERTFREPPLRTPTMVNRAVEILNEAEHLLNGELLDTSEDDGAASRLALAGIEQRLERARSVVDRQPGTAFALASQALLELDELAFARADAGRRN